MVAAVAPASETREAPRADLRPLHAELARAGNVLEVLEMCHAQCGGGLWIAACAEPATHSYVYGPNPVPERDLESVIFEMSRSDVTPFGGSLAPRVIARWLDPAAPVSPLGRGEYCQRELVGSGVRHGALRVVADWADNLPPFGWEVVESVMCAATPHIVLTLRAELTQALAGAALSLCPHELFLRRLQGEVDRAQTYGAELSLAMMEVRSGAQRQPRELTPGELGAVCEVLRHVLRASDVAAHMPDGRFGLLLPLTCQRNALIAIARVIDALRAHPALPDGIVCRTGVSCWSPEAHIGEDLMAQATQALEDAAKAGVHGPFVYV